MATVNLRQSTLTAIISNKNDRLSGKKAKLQDTKNNMVKPSKRAALGTITNTAATRVQPSRAAKQNVSNGKKPAASYRDENCVPKSYQFSNTSGKVQSKQGFSIFTDELLCSKTTDENLKSPTKLTDAVTCLTRQPLAEVQQENLLSDSPMVISSPSNDDCVIIDSDEVDNESEILHIDHPSDVALGVSEYTHDIYKYLRQAELKCRPKPGYMKKQTDINSSMRSILVDWLVEVGEEYKLMNQTLYLTVNYIDRFLSCMSVLRGKLQLVGTACMLIASKFEEIYPPEVSEFVYITDDTYTAKQVLRMEHLILKTLKFDLSAPTAFNFLERYLIAARAPPGGSKLESLAKFLCELTLQEYDPYMKYLPSTIAASCVCIACSTLGMSIWWIAFLWSAVIKQSTAKHHAHLEDGDDRRIDANNTYSTPTLTYHTGYKLEELQSCILDIHKTFLGASSHPQQAVRDKYKLVRNHQVSLIQPPALPPV